jgi:hypothetical protein
MSTQPSRGHDEAWWLRLNLMALTLGLVVVVVLGSAAWARLQPADTTWPPKGPVTAQAAAARPEGHLFYPGAKLNGQLGSDESTSGFGQGSGYAGAILLSSDSSSQVRAWYKDWLLGHGWRLMYSGGGDNGIALAKDQYRRGPGAGREGFILYIDDPAQLAATVSGSPVRANTVIETTYMVTPYFR